jgi:HK97 family phage major capsid protein
MDGIEKEMHDDGQEEIRASSLNVTGKGIYIPYKVLAAGSKYQGRGVTAGTAGEGGNAVATALGSFIDYLYDVLVLRQAGADFLTGLVGNVSFPSEATVAAATWENETSAQDESSPTFGKLNMTAKRLGTFMDVSNQVLLQTSPSIEERLKRQLFNAIAIALDSAGISGSGVSPIPTGILSTAGIGDVAGGTNGLAPTWAHMVALEREVAIDNALMGKLSYLSNAKVRSKLKTTPKETGQALYVIEEKESVINSYPAYFTNLVPSNLVKGSSGAVCSAVVFGNFADLIIGQWGGMEVLTNPYTKAKTAQTELIINTFNDVLVTRPQSFAAMKDALTV